MQPGFVVALIVSNSIIVFGGIALMVLRERARLAAMGELLRGGSDFRSAWGSVRGVRTTLRWLGRANDKRRWTEITAELPAKLPFVMSLRPQGWLDRRRIERDKLVDVVVGDGAFDAAYVIEAAPTDVVKALLTPARRAALAGYGEIELITEPGPPPRLCLCIPARLDEPDNVLPVLQLVVDLAAGVREAYAAVEAAAEVKLVGAPFRGHLETVGEQEAAQRRIDEVRRLAGKRSHSSRLAVGVAFIVCMWLVALGGAMFWASQRL